ncbi:MAG: alpha-L-rhamnosidase C-terminal domain-containing protein, partial [Parafilimonas sp.]
LDTYEDGVGYKHIKIQPHIGGGFTNVAASLQTYYGKLSNEWKTDGDTLMMNVEIPVNTTATVFIPAKDASLITENNQPLSSVKEIKFSGMEDGYVKLELGSGSYHFIIKN